MSDTNFELLKKVKPKKGFAAQAHYRNLGKGLLVGDFFFLLYLDMPPYLTQYHWENSMDYIDDKFVPTPKIDQVLTKFTGE